MKRLLIFVIPAVILLCISIMQTPRSQVIELGTVSHQNKVAISDSIGWIHTWAKDDSSNYNDAWLRVEADSANWNEAFVRVKADSAQWNAAYVRVKADSANWNFGFIKGTVAYTRVVADSANWNEAFVRIENDSTQWNAAYVRVKADSVNWNEAFVRVETDSASWNAAYVRIKADSVQWDDAYVRVKADSANWNTGFVYSEVAQDSVITGVIGYKRRTYLNIDADRTISAAESGSFFIITNISAKRRYTLPPAAIGLEYTFWVEDTDSLLIDGNSTNGIKNLTNAYEVWAATDGVLKIIAGNATTWFVVTEIGTWSPY